MKKICKLLYKLYPTIFQDAFIEDMVGQIPLKVYEPMSDFLAKSGRSAEEWLLWQSWVVQRKMASEPKMAEVYHGMLLEIKLLLMIATKKQIKFDSPKKEETKEVDHYANVESFTKGFKNKKNVI